MPRYSVRGMESVAAVEAADEIAAELATVLARFTALATGPDAGGGVAPIASTGSRYWSTARTGRAGRRASRTGAGCALAETTCGRCPAGGWISSTTGSADIRRRSARSPRPATRTPAPLGPPLRRVEETGCYSSSSPTSCTGSPPSMSSRPPGRARPGCGAGPARRPGHGGRRARRPERRTPGRRAAPPVPARSPRRRRTVRSGAPPRSPRRPSVRSGRRRAATGRSPGRAPRLRSPPDSLGHRPGRRAGRAPDLQHPQAGPQRERVDDRREAGRQACGHAVSQASRRPGGHGRGTSLPRR